jgi:aminoglycoside phosphotransferase (APT) family kinase protein
MRAALDALGRFHDVNPKCLVHGDAHVGNTYLEPGDRPGFLDWQLKQAPWFQDFTFFLVSALDVIDRRNWERSLVSRYVRQLASLGVSALSFEEAWLGYRREISYGLFIWLVNSSDMQPEHIAAANAARFNMAAVDHDSLSLLT